MSPLYKYNCEYPFLVAIYQLHYPKYTLLISLFYYCNHYMIEKLSETHIKDMNSIFVRYDKDKDGRMSTSELCTVMQSIGLNPTVDDLFDILQEIGVDMIDSCIDFHEFVTIISRATNDKDLELEEIAEAFKVFDVNDDGYISAIDLQRVMTSIGESFTDDDVHRLIQEVDSNNDGQIDVFEFTKLLAI